MATIAQLLQSKQLKEIDVELDVDEQKWRCLYATPEFETWLDEVLPTLTLQDIGLDINPVEQIDDMFYQYVAGEDIANPRQFKKLNRTPEGYVWEFKTNDLRVFGWFFRKDHFICTFAELKEKLLVFENLVGTYIAKTIYVRNQLDIDEPKVVESQDYKDVLSTEN